MGMFTNLCITDLNKLYRANNSDICFTEREAKTHSHKILLPWGFEIEKDIWALEWNGQPSGTDTNHTHRNNNNNVHWRRESVSVHQSTGKIRILETTRIKPTAGETLVIRAGILWVPQLKQNHIKMIRDSSEECKYISVVRDIDICKIGRKNSCP